MRNASSFFLILVVLLLASCSKEASIFTELNEIPKQEAKSTLQIKNDRLYFLTTENSASATGYEKTIPLQVLQVVKSESTGQVFVNFGGNGNFTDLKIKASQDLEFYHEDGSISTLTLATDNYIGGNGVLQVIFAIGANDLSRLELEDSQMIIIQEDIID